MVGIGGLELLHEHRPEVPPLIDIDLAVPIRVDHQKQVLQLPGG